MDKKNPDTELENLIKKLNDHNDKLLESGETYITIEFSFFRYSRIKKKINDYYENIVEPTCELMNEVLNEYREIEPNIEDLKDKSLLNRYYNLIDYMERLSDTQRGDHFRFIQSLAGIKMEYYGLLAIAISILATGISVIALIIAFY